MDPADVHGLTARGLPRRGRDDRRLYCAPVVGPIGTLPWYDEDGLVSDGIRFGVWTHPDVEGDFALGERLSAVLREPASGGRPGRALKGFEGIAVSRTDDVAARRRSSERVGAARDLSKQSSATFADKEQIWVDNAESSPFFGNAYVCFARFQGAERHR